MHESLVGKGRQLQRTKEAEVETQSANRGFLLLFFFSTQIHSAL